MEFYKTDGGSIHLDDSLVLMEQMADQSIQLIMTSPPFALTRKKDYGNANADAYLDWFRPFVQPFRRILAKHGSLVLDLGGTWMPGQPVRSLYHYELLIMLCREFNFHLAQEFFWWNPAKMPSPAEWVTIRRIRVKDAVNCLWWLSPSPWPKASNLRVLQTYSESMRHLMAHGYTPKLAPSGHNKSDRFGPDHGGSIPPNLLALAHTESNSAYLRYCKQEGIKAHPARFPSEIPEFFIRLLTDPGDTVFDPFAGSCATGEAAERTKRPWVCCDLREDYLRGALGRFAAGARRPERTGQEEFYKAHKPGSLWKDAVEEPLPADGGKGHHARKRVANHSVTI